MARKPDQPDGLRQLKADIRARTPGRLYVFYGEERFLLNHYLQRLRDILLDPLTESFNATFLNGERFSVQAMADAVERLPMMAERTLVQVDDVSLFDRDEGERDKLAALLSDIPEWCTVVLTYETVAWKPDKRKKALSGALERSALTVEFAKQGQRELADWITRHFREYGKRISPELCLYLIECTGGTMTELAGEIDKIAAYSGGETVVRADVDAVVTPVLDAVVFQMTDLLAGGRYGEALTKLRQLLQMQQEPLAILGAIGGQFRRIATARTLMDAGLGAGELSKIRGLTDYAARRTMAAARQVSPALAGRAAELVMETDYQIKTSYDDPGRLLELLILRLAQVAP